MLKIVTLHFLPKSYFAQLKLRGSSCELYNLTWIESFQEIKIIEISQN